MYSFVPIETVAGAWEGLVYLFTLIAMLMGWAMMPTGR